MMQRLARFDTATVLRRFWHLERALAIACGAWIPAVRRLEAKALLAKTGWQNVMTAGALRDRVFELRYPDRSLESGADAPLIELFSAVLDAPNGSGLLAALADVFVPEQVRAYESYLQLSDEIADGPTHRFLGLALREKRAQVRDLKVAAETEGPDETASQWCRELENLLEDLGGIPLGTPSDAGVSGSISSGRPFRLVERPERDERYLTCSFYWPDTLDPSYPYGDGVRLRVRSAVSHLNEVWAVETAGAILWGFADELGWDFICDAARWMYDESRHMMMGARRLEDWKLPRSMIPLGSYIYEAGEGEDLTLRMAMLAYFETKNIPKKRERVEAFAGLGDEMSERHMDFDWADEAIHAGYGRKWLRRALQAQGRDPDEWPELVARCEELVHRRIKQATNDERESIFNAADQLLSKAEALLTSSRTEKGGDTE